MNEWPIGLQVQEVEREINMRRQVYPRQVADRKMSQKNADQRISLMEAVLKTLKQARAQQTLSHTPTEQDRDAVIQAIVDSHG